MPAGTNASNSSKTRPLFNWILREITGNITLYVRYAELPTADTFKSSVKPVSFDPKQPLIVFGCRMCFFVSGINFTAQWVFFGIYKSSNFTVGDFNIVFTQFEDTNTKEREDKCEHMDQKERIIRAFYPILAGLFLLFGYEALLVISKITGACACHIGVIKRLPIRKANYMKLLDSTR